MKKSLMWLAVSFLGTAISLYGHKKIKESEAQRLYIRLNG
jgi:hypothetical protein